MNNQLKTMIDNMPEKTGKPLEEWIKLLQAQSFAKHSEAVNFLKKEHGITHGFANTIVHLSKNDADEPEDLLANQYKGKEQLKPIYDALIAEIETFGDDITKTHKKGSVSIIRKKQFALIKPATKRRIDLGLKHKDKPTTDRLENSGPFGTMCTHRIRLTSVDEVDAELIGWLKEAYEKAH